MIDRREDIKDPEVYKRRLHTELINRDLEKNIFEHTNLLSLTFKNQSIEKEFRESRDLTSCISLIGLPLTLFCYLITFILIGPNRIHIILTLLLCLLLLSVKALICTIPIICSVSNLFVSRFETKFNFIEMIENNFVNVEDKK